MHSNFLTEAESFYLGLADKTRLRLINLMRDGEVCVSFFTEALNESQPKISRHLAYLRNAGIVEVRRDGKWIHYRLAAPRSVFAVQLLKDTLRWLESDADMQNDYENLLDAYSLAETPITSPPILETDTGNEANRYQSREQLDTFLL